MVGYAKQKKRGKSKMQNVKGKMIEVLKECSYGEGRIKVVVQGWRINKQGQQEKTGPPVDGIGGFKRIADFDESTARRAALENAAAKV